MTAPEEPSAAIERFIPLGGLEQRQGEELALVGLSPAFPERVHELNEGLNLISKVGQFRGFRFRLNPDESHPKVDVEARYSSPYIVEVEADVNGQASLSIEPKWGNILTLTYLRLDQFREFTDGYPTDETILLRASHIPSSYSSIETVPQEDVDDIEIALEDVNVKADLEKVGITPVHFDLNVGFVGRATKLAINMGYADEPRIVEPVFSLREFKAEDTSQNIEAIIGEFGRLLKKHFMRREF